MRWAGYLNVAADGVYGLAAFGADAVIEAAGQAWPFGDEAVEVALQGGLAYAVNVVTSAGEPVAALRWRPPDAADWQTVPAERLQTLAVM